MLAKASRVTGCAVPIWLDPPPGTGVMCVVVASARFVRHPVGYGGAVAHLLAVDLDDPADRTDRKTEPHQPLRRTWIIGWHEAGQLVLAYISMTAVFALVGWVAFGHHRRWWLVNVDERMARWFAERSVDVVDLFPSHRGPVGCRTRLGPIKYAVKAMLGS